MARRGHGEGSISKREDGRWMARLTLEGSGRKYFYGKTRREVQEKLNAALRDQQQGIPIPSERQTLGQFVADWLEHSAKPVIRPSTFRGYSNNVHIHILPHKIAQRPLAKLSPQDLQAFLNEKSASGLSPRSVQYIHAVLRRALGQALKWGVVARNVAKLVDPPKVSRKEIQPFTPEQARAFLTVAEGDRLAALYTVALALGLRQGEALALRWQDVDLDTGMLRVLRTVQRIKGQLIYGEPKSTQSRRTIALPETAVVALQKHRKRQLEERLLAGSEWQDNGLVFTTHIGTALDARNVIRWFKALLKKAGLPDFRFHDLRHTCATLLLVQGEQPRTIMDILGHSQISLTMNTYAHVMPAVRREAAKKMDAILRKAAE